MPWNFALRSTFIRAVKRATVSYDLTLRSFCSYCYFPIVLEDVQLLHLLQLCHNSGKLSFYCFFLKAQNSTIKGVFDLQRLIDLPSNFWNCLTRSLVIGVWLKKLRRISEILSKHDLPNILSL